MLIAYYPRPITGEGEGDSVDVVVALGEELGEASGETFAFSDCSFFVTWFSSILVAIFCGLESLPNSAIAWLSCDLKLLNFAHISQRASLCETKVFLEKKSSIRCKLNLNLF